MGSRAHTTVASEACQQLMNSKFSSKFLLIKEESDNNPKYHCKVKDLLSMLVTGFKESHVKWQHLLGQTPDPADILTRIGAHLGSLEELFDPQTFLKDSKLFESPIKVSQVEQTLRDGIQKTCNYLADELLPRKQAPLFGGLKSTTRQTSTVETQSLLAHLTIQGFEKTEKHMFHCRKLATLGDGTPVLVPASTQPGDLVAILMGRSIPLVLRPINAQDLSIEEDIESQMRENGCYFRKKMNVQHFCTYKFAEYLHRLEHTEDTKKNVSSFSSYNPTVRSVRALSVAAEAYKYLREARIAIKVAEKPFYTAKWIKDYRGHTFKGVEGTTKNDLSYAQTFACIANLEPGSIDIDPGSLNHVMAMSTGNSIYIAAPLLSDPAERCNDGKVKRVIGNVGRPGMAMLITPQRLRMSTLDHNTWNHVNHDGFDGTLENCFQHTTLHLSFTDWEMPIDVGAHGARDREVFFLEAPISIHHRGNWVADIDILGMVLSQDLSVYHLPACEGHENRPVTDPCREVADLKLVAIDSWEELIDTPLEPAVVRAHQNWQARLAATALSIQRGHKTIVLPNSPCWHCCLGSMGISYGHQIVDPLLESMNSDGDEREVDDTSNASGGDQNNDNGSSKEYDDCDPPGGDYDDNEDDENSREREKLESKPLVVNDVYIL